MCASKLVCACVGVSGYLCACVCVCVCAPVVFILKSEARYSPAKTQNAEQFLKSNQNESYV